MLQQKFSSTRVTPRTPPFALLLAGLLGLGSCGPSDSAERVSNLDGGVDVTTPVDLPETGGGTGGVPGAGGGSGGVPVGTGGMPMPMGGRPTGGTGGQAPGTGGMRDAGPDLVVDMNPPEVAPDVGVDTGMRRRALLVVTNPTAPTMGENRLRTLLTNKGFDVVIHDDNANNMAATGSALVLLSSTCESAVLLAKYKDVPIPVISMESAVFDDMKYTAGTEETDYDEVNTTDLFITMPNHPLAAMLPAGRVAVNPGGADCCGVNWGKPNANAVVIASWGTTMNAARSGIFAYEAGAMMLDNFPAPARRVGFFAADTTLQRLTMNGEKLLDAAISWAAP